MRSAVDTGEQSKKARAMGRANKDDIQFPIGGICARRDLNTPAVAGPVGNGCHQEGAIVPGHAARGIRQFDLVCEAT